MASKLDMPLDALIKESNKAKAKPAGKAKAAGGKAAPGAAGKAVRGGGWRARTRCARQRGRALSPLSPTREHDEVRNRGVAASTRPCSPLRACDGSADPVAHRHRAPQRLPRARDATTSSSRSSSRARCAAPTRRT